MLRFVGSSFKLTLRFEHSTAIKNEYHYRLAELLKAYGFSDKQSNKLTDSLSSFLHQDSSKQIEASLQYWMKNIRLQNNEFHKNEDKFKEIFLSKESRLLLMSPDDISDRINRIRSLDILRGKKDLWTLFKRAPSGYFLQDWSEILRKYYYITYKIIPWLEKKDDDMHPLLNFPWVIELPYNTIKSRFLFAQRTGYKELYSDNFSRVNLYTLIHIPVDEFLKIYAPYCTAEEYDAFEILNSSELGEEDDKVFEELIDLAPKSPSKSVKSFIKTNLTESYILNLSK